ncbi:amino acid adenylation domain-containing protein [Paenibacillus sp. sgz500958]|uniref:amino acid adenylation domain-containing protein n=1 Tax=Paenibacillus sp. sgz500958 TaxID=3242475 RepID=UPI0036D21478
MHTSESESVKNRVSALSESKRILLENLLEEQRRKKRQSILKEKGLSGVEKRDSGITALPCTYMQKKFWYVEQLFNESHAYNVSGYVEFHGALQVEYLYEAFKRMIERQEVLRSKFKEVQGNLQVELGETFDERVFKVCDMSNAGISRSDIQQMMVLEGMKPFELAEGQLIQLICYKLSDTEWVGQIVWHHIVSDGYSIGVFIKELLEWYESYAGRSGEPVSPSNIQYYDYVLHMNDRIAKGEFNHQLQFWKEHLDGSPMTCAIPTDYALSHELTYQGDRVEFSIGETLKSRLETTAKKHGVTLFVLYMSALKLMLHKYIRQNDIIVGVPVAGRNDEELHSIVGCFLNMLPIRSQMGEEQMLFEYIQTENNHVMQALKHQDIPFDFIVEELGVERDLLSTPIYQVVFSYENNVLKDIENKDFHIKFGELDLKTAKVDLALEVNEEKDGLSAWFEYKPGKFSRKRIETIKDYYLQILDTVSQYEDVAIKDIEMITAAEKAEILYSFNRPVSGYQPQTIKQLFEAQAGARNEAVAAVCGDESITYHELNKRSNQLANVLRKRGVGRESIVGMMLDKSIEALIAILGITKAGGAFMPLDSSYPKERIQYIFADSGARHLITAGIILDEIGADHIVIDDALIEQESPDNLSDISSSENLAYIIYTSGTTGKPKGVMVEHTGIVNLRDYFITKYKVTSDDTILQFANLVFDASVWEFVMGLLTGAKLCIVTKEAALHMNRFEQELKKHEVTVATLPPQYWNEISGRDLGLRLLITAGSESNTRLVEQLPPSLQYFNAYGPSETTVCASDWWFERDKQIPKKIPIGRPISNMQIYIMNHNTLCGKGRIGELCITGVGIARGYLNRPELTAAKFNDNPFGPGKLYRTGDYASWLEDGNIAFYGRIDTQVKIRGHRIEIGEIESKLISHNNVNAAAVSTEMDSNSNPYLAAYLVLDAPVTIAEIRAFLNERVPSYMIPAVFYTADALPLNINGKVDFTKLSALGSKLEPGNEYKAPSTDIERKLEEIWSGLLGVDRVSIRDNFFEIGGDSIISMQVIAKAAEEGIKLELKSFYDDKCIEQMGMNATPMENIQRDQGEVAGTYLLTPIQRWFIGQNFSDFNHWNQSVCLELKEKVDPKVLNDALNEVCRQHDVLRTRVAGGSTLGNVFGNAGRYAEIMPFAYSDRLQIVGTSVANQHQMQQQIIGLQKSLRLETGEVFKGLLIQDDTGVKSRLVLTAHHLVCDAVSYRIIIEDLFNFYQALSAKEKVKVPLKTTSFIRWSQEAEAYSASFEAITKKNEWNKDHKTHCREAHKNGSNSNNTEADAATFVCSLPEETSARLLTDVSKSYSIKPGEVMIAAMELMLRNLDGADHTIYMESHGRDMLQDKVDLSRTVGWFTNWYPLYFAADQSSDLGRTLKVVKDGMAAAEKRRFEYLISDYPKGAVEVVFNYMGHLDNHNSSDSPFELLGGESLYTRGLTNERVSLLEVNAYVLRDKLTFEWVYNQNLYSKDKIAEQAQALLGNLLDIIEYCMESEDSGVSAADFLDVDTEDLDFILSKFN